MMFFLLTYVIVFAWIGVFATLMYSMITAVESGYVVRAVMLLSVLSAFVALSFVGIRFL